MAKKQSVANGAKSAKTDAAVPAVKATNLVANGAIVNTTTTEAEVIEVVVRAAIKAEQVYNLSTDQIDAAIVEGWLRWSGGTPGERNADSTWINAVAGTRVTALTDVTISADKSPTKREEKLPYEKLEAVSFEGMVLLAGGKAEPAVLRGDAKLDPRSAEERIKGVPDHFNYGLDLDVKRNLRKALEGEISGPEKAIAQIAKGMLAAKMAKSLPAALAMARTQYEAFMAAEGSEETAEAGE